MLRAAALVVFSAAACAAQDTSGWASVSAVLSERCAKCHSDFDAPMGLALVSYSDVMAGSWTGPVIIPGDPDASALVHRIEGRAEPRMPLDGPPYLSPEEIATIRDWIAAGAPEDAGVVTAAAFERQRPGPGEPVLYSDIEPVLQKRCAKCHSDNSKLGAPPEGLRLDSLQHVLAGGERIAVVPGNPELSELWRRVAGYGSPRMPFDGPPWLPEEDIALIREWIAQGALDDEGVRASVPVGREVRLRGILTAPDAIDGGRFRITGGTRIDKSPRVGFEAELRGMIGEDGQVTATRLRSR